MATSSEKKAIIELYVGWFNRVPDVDGINFWIKEFDAGANLQTISGKFYDAATLQFSVDTGYSVGMSDNAFVTQLYDGVMGRNAISGLAPNAGELAYWVAKLNNDFSGDKGSLLVQMITEIKAFDATGNADITAVQNKFSNKMSVAETLSVTGSPLWSGTTVAEGKAALASVTDDIASVTTAVEIALNGGSTSSNVTVGVGAASTDLNADTLLNETFGFDVAAALASVENTQVVINNFDVANDKLQIDLLTANSSFSNINQLNGVEGIAVQISVINQQTIINFGSDADGTVVAITIAGISDPNTIAIEVI